MPVGVLWGESEMTETVKVPESVSLMADVRSQLERYPALSPISMGPMVEMPCCGGWLDFEAIDSVPNQWSKIYWPPRWTCGNCGETFTLNHDESALAPLEDSP
jgi:hypothetical protein